MYCPFCRADDTKVVDTRLAYDGNEVRRRRECLKCNERFTTYEVPELLMPKVIKRDGRRVPFDEEKLRVGVNKALEKRPISSEQIETMIQKIMHALRARGEREVSSEFIGNQIMTELREIDQVAYVRFASVYRSFQDVNAFSEMIKRLEAEKKNK